MEIGERKKRILSAIVESYITTGEPVGSKLIAGITGMGLSSATIRNEMAELAELGYIEQPHTSAGRIPTQKGYRLYVDSLMESYELSDQEKQQINMLMKLGGGDLETTLEKAGEMLAEITGFASVSTAPQDNSMVLRRVEVGAAGRRTILLVLLTSTGIIKSRICRIEDDVTPEMLSYFDQLVNDKLCGKAISEITPELIEEATGELYEYTYSLGPVIQMIASDLKTIADTEVFLGGESNLLSHQDFSTAGVAVADMIRYLESRKELAKLVHGVGNGVSVRIGTENGTGLMQHSSLIVAPYHFLGKPAGTIGIIGPTRIHYARMMSSLDYFSNVLGRLISEIFGD